MLEHKSFGVAELKATGPASSGAFEAIVSVFGNVDKGGDRVLPGFFADTLKAPPEGRGFPPVVWTHLWGVVPIGSTQKAEEVQGYTTAKGETVDGLYIAGDLFVDEHQTAKEVYTAMSRKNGDGLPVLRDWSFGYSATEFTTKDDDGFEPVSTGHVRDLIKGELYEVGPTLVGMNEQASTVGVKSALQTQSLETLLATLKAGARNSAKDAEMLQQIHDLTTELGIDCGAKAARVDRGATGIAHAIAAKAYEAKGYDDVDSYAVYLLTSMIELGSNYIIGQDDPARVASMRALLLQVAGMLGDILGQARNGEAVSGTASFVDMVEKMLPTSGQKDVPSRRHAVDPSLANELLLAFPR